MGTGINSSNLENTKRRKETQNRSRERDGSLEKKKITKYDWNQTDSEVTIVLYVGNSVNKSGIEFKSVNDRLCELKLDDGRWWNCELNEEIVNEGTTFMVRGNKLILKLVKKVPEMTWNSLQYIEKGEKYDKEKDDLVEIFVNPTFSYNHYEKQQNDQVIVYVYVKSIVKETIEINFEETKLTVKFHTSDVKFLESHKNTSPSTLFVWTLNLKRKIIPKFCSHKLSSIRLELLLRKAENTRWDGLETIKETGDGIALPSNTWVPAVPSISSTVASVETENSSLDNKASFTLPSNWKIQSSQKPTCMVSPLNKDKKSEQITSPGLTGLDNLGNTCFMNSVVQCLANTLEFRDYFLDSQFQSDINTENALGMGGKLALSFAVLLRVLWSGTHRSFAPSKLKNLIALKANQFTGFAQHDAQEFMAFLLDGLHEDLNRVKEKPYIENVDSDEDYVHDDMQRNEKLADESWFHYKSRNDSIVVDLFQGQYKSKLVCPECHKVSITFDPLLYLPVQLPKKQIHVNIIFFWRDTYIKKPCKFSLTLPCDSTIEHLKEIISSKTGIKSHNQKILEVYKGKIHKLFGKGTSLSSVSTHDILFCFEILDESLSGEPVIQLAVTQRMLYPRPVTRCSFCRQECVDDNVRLKRCTKCYRASYCDQNCQKNHWSAHKVNCKVCPEIVGCPFMLSLPASQTTFSKLSMMMESFSRYSVNVFKPPVRTPSPPTDNRMTFVDTSSEQTSSCTYLPEHSSDNRLCTSVADVSDNPSATAPNRSGDQEVPSSCVLPSGEQLTSVDDESSNDISNRSVCSTDSSPTRLVFGKSQDDVAGRTSSFFIKPVDKFAFSTNLDRLEDKGDEPLDLSSLFFLGMDWRNNEKSINYVLVESKEIEYEEDDACIENVECTLDQCLQLFTEPEMLSPQEAWYCSRCKKHQEAIKQMSLWRLPTTLIVQLKRFSFKNLIWRDKIDKMIHFPTRNLDVSPYYCGPRKSGSCVYDLYAVINHHGGILGGHYTAYARCVDLNDARRSSVDWRLFDDSRVNFCDESDVVSKAAYVLFYRRRGVFDRPSYMATASCDNKLTSTLTWNKNEHSCLLDSDDESDDQVSMDSINVVNETIPKMELRNDNYARTEVLD